MASHGDDCSQYGGVFSKARICARNIPGSDRSLVLVQQDVYGGVLQEARLVEAVLAPCYSRHRETASHLSKDNYDSFCVLDLSLIGPNISLQMMRKCIA